MIKLVDKFTVMTILLKKARGCTKQEFRQPRGFTYASIIEFTLLQLFNVIFAFFSYIYMRKIFFIPFVI